MIFRKVPIRYLPKNLSKNDKKTQIKQLNKSKKLYKNHKYYTRTKIASYKSKKSKHVLNARKIYKVTNIIAAFGLLFFYINAIV